MSNHYQTPIYIHTYAYTYIHNIRTEREIDMCHKGIASNVIKVLKS